MLRALCVLAFGLVLSACSSLNMGVTSFPLRLPMADNHFPANAEVLAMLEWSTTQGAGQFFLALGTRQNEVTLALLSPQGLPVGTIDYRSGRWQLSRTRAGKQHLQPQMLLAYLGLIYFDDDAISVQLVNGWRYTSAADERLFTFSGKGEHAATAVRIRYSGQGPWYQAVSLEDTARGIQLSINTLEYKHVVSE